MLKFKEYLKEGIGTLPVAISKNQIDLSKDATQKEINTNLSIILNKHFANPYDAFSKVRKILESYGIELPHVHLQDGEEIIPIGQFSSSVGVDLHGNFNNGIVEPQYTHFLYFFYEIDNSHLYSCKAFVLGEDELNKLLDVIESEFGQFSEDYNESVTSQSEYEAPNGEKAYIRHKKYSDSSVHTVFMNDPISKEYIAVHQVENDEPSVHRFLVKKGFNFIK